MTGSDLAAIEARFGCPMPAELSMLLRAGVPVSPKWARWTEGADVVAAVALVRNIARQAKY